MERARSACRDADRSTQPPYIRFARACRSSACLLYGRYSLGSGAVADSACTMMVVTRQPSASLIA